MPLLRSPSGAVIDVPAEQVGNYVGYEPVEGTDASRAIASPESPDRGVLGGINAAATGILSGATLGLSDYALKGLLDQGEFERLAAEREGHPIASGAGQVAGAILPAVAAPGSLLGSAPSGLISHALSPMVAEGRAIGGAAGVGKVLAAGGIEGAVQNAGMYLSDTALGDRELSAEGLAASLGPGFAFGVAGGAAALGIEHGTIAARRLFSRVGAADKAALEAESAWQAAHQSTLEANDAAADMARARLAETRAAREQAQLAKQRAKLRVVETEQAAPQIDATYKAASVEREQVRDAAKAAYEQAATPPAQPITPRLHEGLRGMGLTDAEISAMSPADLAEATRLIEGADTELAAMQGARPPLPEAKAAELAQAVAEHDAARAELDDMLRHLEAPDIGPGVAPPSRDVPIGEFGAPGQRGYDPGNVKAPGPPSVVEAQTADVTAIGKKKFAQGTPTESATLGAPVERSLEQQHDDIMAHLKTLTRPEDVPLRRQLSKQADELLDRMSEAAPAAAAPATAVPAEPAGPHPIEKGKTVAELKHPDETAENFVLRRMREQGQPFGPDKRFLGSLGIDWSVPENRALMLKMMRNGDAAFARADLVGAMDPEMVTASEIVDKGPGGFGGSSWHFIRDEGQPIKTLQELQAAAQAPRGRALSEGEFRERQRALRASLSEGEIKQSLQYTREDYNDINRFLRGDKRVPKLGDREAAIIPALDAIIDRSVLSEPIVTYRAAHFDPHEVAFGLKPGGVFEEPAFMSTSYRQHNIGRFGNVDFVITSPVGTRIAPIPSSASEGEFLLPRGTRLRITNRVEHPGVDEFGHRHVTLHATVEPTAAKVAPAATDTLTGQMRGMQSHLGAGADLKAMGAPARAEYAAAKAERTAAAAEHFRAKANAKNYAGSQMAADEAAARSELTTGDSAIDKKNPKRVEASRKAAAASVERRREIHSAVASNLPDDLQVAWDKEGYKFMQEEAARIRGNKDPISAASDISESFAEKYGSASESGRGYEGDRYHRRLEIEAKHADSWAKEQNKRFNAAAGRDEAERVRDQADRIASIAERWKRPADDVTEIWSERAAVLEYEGGMSRIEAERTALDEISGMVDDAHGRAAMDEFFRNLTRPKTRDAYVAQNIGRAMREEGSHAKALAKVEREWADMGGAPSARTAQQEAPQTWREFTAGKIGEYMKSEGGHAGAMKRLGQEWQEIKAGGSARGVVAPAAAQNAVEDVAAAAEVVTKYERASAKLTEALGPEAPPAAQEAATAFREAEDHAERKQMARTTRAIDDSVDSQGRPRTVVDESRKRSEARMAAGSAEREARRAQQAAAVPAAPARPSWEDLEQRYGKYAGQPALPPTSEEALAAAKSEHGAADVALQRAKIAETEAGIGSRSADEAATQARAAAEAARPLPAAPTSPSTLGSISTAIGIAGEVGIPGVPHPKDIPVIGPLLSMYLKYKALKYATGRMVGRVSATGDARAAALVTRTKEKIAVAVDRTLGLVEAGASKGRGGIVAATTVLGHRVFDDGEPDAPKGANAQQLAAVRIREIANASTRPDLVSALVRKEMRGVVDPDLIEAAEKHLTARFEALAKVMPKAPPPNPYSKREWLPSQAAAYELSQRLAVVHDPEQAFIDPTPAKAQTAAAVYPKLLQYAQQRLMDRIGDASKPVPYEQRLRGSLVFKVPLDDSLHPDHAAILATAHAPSPITDAQPAPQQAPTPSIAANTNLTSVYQTGSDRRAMR